MPIGDTRAKHSTVNIYWVDLLAVRPKSIFDTTKQPPPAKVYCYILAIGRHNSNQTRDVIQREPRRYRDLDGYHRLS
jgi:hypothetical protein